MMGERGWKACLHYLLNEVDLSDFNPGAAPVMTDFVRDIQDASEDIVTTAIKELIAAGLGNFKADLLTSTDIAQTLRAANTELQRVPTASVIGKRMQQDNLGLRLRARSGDGEKRLWAIRNRGRYKNMKSGELWREYERQLAEVRSAAPMGVVS